jgi:hypothetical protein
MKKTLTTRQKGAAFITIAIAINVIFGLTALTVDVGAILTAQHQLQVATDAAALGGTTGLLYSQNDAQTRAIDVGNRNTVLGNRVLLQPENISFPTGTKIQVSLNHTVDLFFGQAVGMNNVLVSTGAVGAIENLKATDKFRPFAIPEIAWEPGKVVVLKQGTSTDGKDGTDAKKTGATIYQGANSSWHYPICYPPVNRGIPITGASIYKNRIEVGYDDMIYLDDELLVETGKMIGPTKKGIEKLINKDPEAYWDNTTSSIVDSKYPGNSSPRIIKIPMFDSAQPPPNGRNSVIVSNMGAFFLLPMQGNDVTGVLMTIFTRGVIGTKDTHLKIAHLTAN